MSGLFFRLGALNAGASVLIYAMGSHRPWEAERKMIFTKAFEMQMSSSIGMMLCSITAKNKMSLIPALLLFIGSSLFSGFAYNRCFNDDKKYNYIMPVGGMCIISGWGMMVLL